MDLQSAHFRPNRKVLEALRAVRSQGIARYLGKIDLELVDHFQKGAFLLEGQTNHDYVDDVAIHWNYAGFQMTEEDKESAYTKNLRENVAIAKISDESGEILLRYQGSILAEAVNKWLSILEQYADNISLTRINVLRSRGHVLEHIDPPDQNMIQCLLTGETVFEFRTKTGRQFYNMQIGDIWWFNTTWPHQTHNASNVQRLLLHTHGTLKDEFLHGMPEAEPSEFIPNL